jgi:hypothetical protein
MEPCLSQTIELTVKGLDGSLLGSTLEMTFIPWLNAFFIPSIVAFSFCTSPFYEVLKLNSQNIGSCVEIRIRLKRLY